MTDYTGTGQKEDPILTNLRCWNCNISLSPTKSEYEKDYYRCPGCDKIPINKTILPERSEGRVSDERTLYQEYLTSYHGLMAPLSYEKWKETVEKNNKELIQINKELAQINSRNPKDQIGITKLPLHLIPAPALARLSKVLELGAKKYGPYNWRETEVNLTVYLAAGLRHVYSILDGEDIDPESGQHHAAHLMACAAIILDAIEVGKLINDRPPPGNFAHLVTQLQEKLK